jgi:CBS domain-containing protein
MATVFQLLVTKGRTVHTIDKAATVFDAISKMVANNVGALVVQAGAQPCGILTERDYLRKVALHGRASRATLVEEIMSRNLIHVGADTSIDACMALMTRNRIRHLPVFDGGTLVGLISIGDVVKHLARDRQEQIEQLTAYIQGTEMAPISSQPPLV